MIYSNKVRVFFSSCTLSGLTYEHQDIRWAFALTNKKPQSRDKWNSSRALETRVPSTSPNPLAPFPQESARNLHNPNRLLKWMHLKWKDVDVFLAGSFLQWFQCQLYSNWLERHHNTRFLCHKLQCVLCTSWVWFFSTKGQKVTRRTTFPKTGPCFLLSSSSYLGWHPAKF